MTSGVVPGPQYVQSIIYSQALYYNKITYVGYSH